jgi:hypothetical protein
VAEQAFAYAIHPEIRTFFYGLCNGRELCVYKWTRVEPVLAIPVTDLDARWEELVGLLGPQALTKSHLSDFLPDFGLSYLKLGGDRNAVFDFAGTEVNLVARVDENTFTLTSVIGGEDDAYLGSFNFPRSLYEEFLSCVPAGAHDKVRTALSESHISSSSPKRTTSNSSFTPNWAGASTPTRMSSTFPSPPPALSPCWTGNRCWATPGR